MQVLEKDKKYIWHPFTQHGFNEDHILIKSAKGAYLYGENNQKWFDGISSWWVNTHGHGNERIAKAIYTQALKLEHVLFADFTHEPAINLSERLLSIAPAGLKKVFFSDNGSTAVEVALKMAIQYFKHKNQKRNLFLAMPSSYHGDTFGAMSVSSKSIYTKNFDELLFNVIFPKNLDLDEIENILKENYKDIAAIIIEPLLQAAGGMIIWPQGFLSKIKELCQKYGILLIADEIMTGFFRTGQMFALNHENISPDIMCLSKGLTAGFLPLSVTLCTDKIYYAFYEKDFSKTFFHGHSFTANPIGCAAALESLQIFNEENTINNINILKESIKYNILNFPKSSHIKDIRYIGLVGIIELDNIDLAQKIKKYAIKNGLYLRPLQNVLYFMPPYCTTKEEVDLVFSILGIAIKSNRLP